MRGGGEKEEEEEEFQMTEMSSLTRESGALRVVRVKFLLAN